MAFGLVFVEAGLIDVDVLLERIYAMPPELHQSVIDRPIGWAEATRPAR